MTNLIYKQWNSKWTLRLNDFWHWDGLLYLVCQLSEHKRVWYEDDAMGFSRDFLDFRDLPLDQDVRSHVWIREWNAMAQVLESCIRIRMDTFPCWDVGSLRGSQMLFKNWKTHFQKTTILGTEVGYLMQISCLAMEAWHLRMTISFPSFLQTLVHRFFDNVMSLRKEVRGSKEEMEFRVIRCNSIEDKETRIHQYVHDQLYGLFMNTYLIPCIRGSFVPCYLKY